MKKSAISLSLLVIILFWASPAASQSKSADRSLSAKIVSLSGKLSADGKSFLAKHGQIWTITNPDAVLGQAGHELKLKCQILAASHEIQVIAVRVVATQVQLKANPGDAAFRR